MHTGICTGLVVTGNVNLEKGTHGVLGDTINVAFRLSSLAKPGEIIVDTGTYRRAAGHFNFDTLEPATVNGKTEPVRIFRVISPKEKPTKTHRLSGMRSELIGRKVEMAQLQGSHIQFETGERGRVLHRRRCRHREKQAHRRVHGCIRHQGDSVKGGTLLSLQPEHPLLSPHQSPEPGMADSRG